MIDCACAEDAKPHCVALIETGAVEATAACDADAGCVVAVVPKNPTVPPLADKIAPSSCGSLNATPTGLLLGMI